MASDNIDWKSKCVELQEIVAQYQDKLGTQQKENETLKSDFRYFERIFHFLESTQCLKTTQK